MGSLGRPGYLESFCSELNREGIPKSRVIGFKLHAGEGVQHGRRGPILWIFESELWRLDDPPGLRRNWWRGEVVAAGARGRQRGRKADERQTSLFTGGESDWLLGKQHKKQNGLGC